MPHLRRTTALAFLVALLAVAAFGCSGDDGATGPTGPAGPAGNANVIHSDWKSPSGPSRDTTIDGTLLKYYNVSAPPLTQAHCDSALLAVYMRVGSLGPYLLPYQSVAGGKDNTIGCIFKPGIIHVYRMTPSATIAAELTSLPQSLQYRYIIAPGGTLGTRANEVIDWSDYEAVKARFGLVD